MIEIRDITYRLLPSIRAKSDTLTRSRELTLWLQELPFAPVRYTLKLQADAWQGYFKGQRGRPKLKVRRGCLNGHWR